MAKAYLNYYTQAKPLGANFVENNITRLYSEMHPTYPGNKYIIRFKDNKKSSDMLCKIEQALYKSPDKKLFAVLKLNTPETKTKTMVSGYITVVLTNNRLEVHMDISNTTTYKG